MDIIKCGCGYYKQLNDELCPKCGADYSAGDEYEVLDDQETAYERWSVLGEKGFNDYMESINKPQYMLCPKCYFKMLTTETRCPRCGISVKYKGPGYYKYDWISKLALGFSFVQILCIVCPIIIVLLVYIISLFM